jgi:hypothetical protein
MSKLSAKGQWLALNRLANTYRVTCLILGGCLVITLSILAYVTSLPPVVVEKGNNEVIRYHSTRKNNPIGKNEIKRFVKTFIKANYEWKKFERKTMLFNIRPFVTDDFYSLVSKNSKKKVVRPDGEDKFSQYVGEVNVSVTDKEVVAQFDRVIRLKGLPLISVTQISLQILKDSPNKWNPLGLYVNGLIEHEVK